MSGRILPLGVAAGFLAASAVTSQAGLRALGRLHPEGDRVSGGSLREVRPLVASAAAIGFRRLAADLVWIEGGQYFGEDANAAENFRRYGALAREALTLVPRWTAGYEYAAIALGFVLGKTGEAGLMLSTGLRENPGHPRLTAYVAGLAATKANNDAGLRALLESLAADPAHPPLLDRSLALLYEKKGLRDEAVRAWKRVEAQQDDPISQRVARAALRRLGVAEGGPGGG